MLAAQPLLGNRAVARMVQRVGGPPPPLAPAGPAVAHKTEAEFDAMTLGDFDAFARSQADWAADPALPAPRRKSLLKVLEWARVQPANAVAACSGMKVTDLEALPNAKLKQLNTYSRAVGGTETISVNQIDDPAKAIEWGKAIETLEGGVPKGSLHHAVKQDGTNFSQLEDLVAKGEVANFANYVKRSGAYIEAENGMDVISYLEMVVSDGKNPATYIGKLPRIRNYHRFEAAMLDVLQTNLGDKSRKKPLLLILHSGADHNGAFHRDSELTNMAKAPQNLTIMVEGATSLGSLGGTAQDLARDYGQRRRIQQLMIAGHGNSTMMELTSSGPTLGGTPDASKSLDLDNNRARTLAFLKALMGSMDKGPNAKIVLNACLTASEDVNANLDPDPAKARDQILKSLASRPSLAGQLQQIAGADREVLGNVSSVPAGTYHDPATGLLAPTVPSDPAATNPDMANYTELGEEPEGAMRAALVTWAKDQAEWLKRINARLARLPITGWQDRVIHVMYAMIKAEPNNADLMNRLARSAAGGLGEQMHLEYQKGSMLGGVTDVPALQAKALLAALHPHAPADGSKLGMSQVWMHIDGAKQSLMMSDLNRFATPKDAVPHLSEDWIDPKMGSLLPVADGTKPSLAQAKLALWSVTRDIPSAAAVAFLHEGAKGTRKLEMPAGNTAAGLLRGLGQTEEDVLATIGLGPAAVPVGGSAPTPNIDLDGDGTNDYFVEPMTRHGLVTAMVLNVRSKPGIASPRIAQVRAGTKLYVIGQAEGWYAVEHSGKTAFVHPSWVRNVPAAASV
ncbi:MAG: SH3 domain-containing protein [Dehalococcoidia bacterium]